MGHRNKSGYDIEPRKISWITNVHGSDGIVRTENANAAAAFPNAQPGDVLGTTLSVLPTGVSAGVRCVRDL